MKMKINPFKNYKSALFYLFKEANGKMMLSNYEPTPTDWAIYTLFRSKEFMKRLRQ